jgi:hypothetical protein
MLRRQILVVPFGALLLVLAGSPMRTPAAYDDDKEIKAAGLVFDRDYKNNEHITIKTDGEDAPVKYIIPKDANKKVFDGLKSIFGANRAAFTYKQDGDKRIIVSIQRQVLKAQGTITGKVVGVHGDFWIELKPKDGVPDGFAPGGDTWNDPKFKEWRSSLKPGDSVTLSYTTDGERHRIVNKTYRTNPSDNK